MLDNLGKDTPGVGSYTAIKPGTFEAISNNSKVVRKGKPKILSADVSIYDTSLIKSTITPEPSGTFSKAKRFHEHKATSALKANAPHGYGTHRNIGTDKGVPIGPVKSVISP